VRAVLLSLAFGLASSEAAAITQPTPCDSTKCTVIPVLTLSNTCAQRKNVQACINDNEERASGAPGTIDAVADALIKPEAFQPTCSLTFTPIAKGGSLALAFGWYNVSALAGEKPTLESLRVMVTLPATFLTVEQLAEYTRKLELGKAPPGAYEGGEIGFWLATSSKNFTVSESGTLTTTPQSIFYTQHDLNAASSGATKYFQVLTWQSVAIPNAFYFGWEDLPAGSGSDNDFEDLLFIVSGIQCTGGGAPCATGGKGVCATGTMQCQKGELACVQHMQPREEQCNALDDDCDGTVDDGDLCGVSNVCVRGRCMPRCGTGEFRCAGDEVCTAEGVCIDAACATVQCPPGQICAEGRCREACEGVTCPYGQVCRNGGCVDPCGTVECDDGYTCVLGVCESCECTACPSGFECTNDYVCIEPACATVTCESGTHCVAGACVDNCLDAVCPLGQSCLAGECVATQSGGGDGGGGGEPPLVLDAGLGEEDAGNDQPNNSTGGTSAMEGGSRNDVSEASCACTVPGQKRGLGAPHWLTLIALVASGLRAGRRFLGRQRSA
jgi:hypothetical protein